MLKDGSAGCVYLLFEHKSYHDKYVHLQILEYMVKIWRLHIKQHKGKSVNLPISNSKFSGTLKKMETIDSISDNPMMDEKIYL